MPINIPFPRDRQKWDRFNRFYVEHSMGIVQFDTGELVATQRRFYPDVRGCATDFGVSFLYPHDRNPYLRKLQTPEGEPIRQSWLHPSQCFMVDNVTRQMISLVHHRNMCTGDDLPVPDCLQTQYGVLAYCAGPKSKWVSANHVRYSKPAALTKAEKNELKDSLMLVKAQARVGAIPAEIRAIRELCLTTQDSDRWFGPVGYKQVLGIDVTALHPYNRAILAFYGYAPFRDFFQVTEAKVVM